MKKKKILEITAIKPHVKPKSRHHAALTAQTVQIDGDEYLIVDLFDKAKQVYRIALTENNYAHYSYETQKWDTKTSWNNPYDSEIGYANISTADNKLIRKWLGVNTKQYGYIKDTADFIFDYERCINIKRKSERKKREDSEMEELFLDIPEIPNEFERLIECEINTDNVIAYKRRGAWADYTCLQCGKHFTKRITHFDDSIVDMGFKPYKGGILKCQHCGKTGVLSHAGYMHDKVYWHEFTALLYQSTKSGRLLIRVFNVRTSRNINSCMDADTYEDGRIFLAPHFDRQYLKYYDGWSKTSNVCISSSIDVEYGRNCIDKSQMKYYPEGLKLLLNCDSTSNMHKSEIRSLITYANCLQIETLYKLGFTQICKEILWAEGRTRIIDKKEKEAAKILRIKKEELRWLQSNDGAHSMYNLEMIRFANAHNISMQQWDKFTEIYDNCRYYIKNLEHLLKYHSINKLYNIIQKYKKDYHDSISLTINEYSDYLNEREAAGDDMTNTVYLIPRSLHETYTRIRLENEQKRNANYISEMQKKYSNITKYCKKVEKRYTWQKGSLIIRPANDAEEIVTEGRILHHCVGSDNQRYMKNYNEGAGYILLVRRKSALNEPYITVELVNDEIKQWYGIHDTKPEREEIQAFLDDFIKHLHTKKIKISA